MAWCGQPALIEELLLGTPSGFFNKRRHHPESDPPGYFGLGWYDEAGGVQAHRALTVPWHDSSLPELVATIKSPLVFAHVESESSAPSASQGGQPFCSGRWMFVHKGMVGDLERARAYLRASPDPAKREGLDSASDSDILFTVLLDFGLEEDPPGALERVAGWLEDDARVRGGSPVRGSMALTNGTTLWAVRYSLHGGASPLWSSADPQALRMLYPGDARLQQLRDDDHMLISEAPAGLLGAWDQLAERTLLAIENGRSERLMFRPRAAAGSS
jgi:glutamine amidotransferase